jgi:o-succinylbenzoate synthase
MFSYEIIPHNLIFSFLAGTSRGVLNEKKSWFIRLSHSDFPGRLGWGECGILPGLSPENVDTFQNDLTSFSDFVKEKLSIQSKNWEKLSSAWLEDWIGLWLPSAIFGWETAWLDWVNGGKQLITDAVFHSGNWKIPINGLVWMNPEEIMEKNAIEKLAEGFDTIKLKIGALDWNSELAMIKRLRSEFSSADLTIRLDANGAWEPAEALEKLSQLADYDIHSIEQPIKPGQFKAMAELCKKSLIPIALDEELIGHQFDHQKFSILDQIQPAFIVIKPSLVGGLGQTNQWIKMAEDMGIEWWITSMLESNIGLNSIAQLTAQYRAILPQGLGTGKIYTNNIPSPLSVNEGFLEYNIAERWDFSQIE